MINAKGSVFDVYYMLVVVLVFAIVAIVCAMVWFEITSNPVYAGAMSAAGVDSITNPVSDAILGLDNIIVTFFLLMNVAALVSAYFIRSHPIFFVLSLLLMGFFTVASVMFSNVYYAIASTSFISTYANMFPLTYVLFTWLPSITLVLSSLLAIVMYGRPQGGGVPYAY